MEFKNESFVAVSRTSLSRTNCSRNFTHIQFMRIITRTVLILSFVSMFADIASEMLYPIIPVYLKEIGFSIMWIGILEGFVNFTAGVSKGYFGKLSDEKGVRLPFVKLGYFLSALSKPLIGFFVAPIWIFFVRTLGSPW